MGIHVLGSRSSYDQCRCQAVCQSAEVSEPTEKRRKKKRPANPDPKNYRIMDFKQLGNFLIMKVRYPDCTNYEGKKILVYKNITISDLRKQGSIDPHFCGNKKFHSPIARFVPTDEGMKMAEKFCLMEINGGLA